MFEVNKTVTEIESYLNFRDDFYTVGLQKTGHFKKIKNKTKKSNPTNKSIFGKLTQISLQESPL